MIFFFCLGVFLSGCGEFHYYLQAIEGHLDILNRKKDLRQLLQDPQTPPPLARKLRLVQHVRQFAKEQLQLPRIQGYRAYADIEKTYVSTVVTASQALKLEPYQWCFLFVGCVAYRGYFDSARAKAYAGQLAKEGWDVALGKVRAYSTLKWLNNEFMPDYFKDPILNTFIERSDREIIGTLIHEMAHQVVFVAGDTSFNESFAVFVEEEGMKQYMQSRNQEDSPAYQRYLQSNEDQNRFLRIIRTFYKRFEELYHSPLSEEEKLLHKKRLFREMREKYRQNAHQFKVLNYRGWFEQPLNNAHLLGIKRYHSYTTSFQRIFEEQQRHWPAFFKTIEEIADLPKDERDAYLQSRQSTNRGSFSENQGDSKGNFQNGNFRILPKKRFYSNPYNLQTNLQ